LTPFSSPPHPHQNRNPAVEQQAQDRIHRLGQFKPIRVTRFVIGATIEERILKLQEKKQLVGGLGGGGWRLGGGMGLRI
jgi:DNA repair protein RAD16